MLSRLNPAVPRHYLFAVAGLLWTVGGVLLCVRAAIWMQVLTLHSGIAFGLMSLAIAVAGQLFLFFRIVQKNIDRISRLPERACVFAFTPWRGYTMIAAMVTICMTLRDNPISSLLHVPCSFLENLPEELLHRGP